jgi:hypothetical protein
MGVSEDARFGRLKTDPVFRKVKREDSKLQVDSRFSAVFDDNQFKSEPKIDKYGRTTTHTDNKMDRFYKPEHTTEQVDAARGDGCLQSSDEEHSDVQMHSDLEQFESDEDIPRGEETCRFAVVNMDWDHIKAKDLFKVFDAFKPKHGIIRNVKIYLSDFGKSSLERERTDGPPAEIFLDEGPLIQEDDGQEFNVKELRKYQLDRLKYYYAIVETDSVDTARAIYDACDGSEFESSGNS